MEFHEQIYTSAPQLLESGSGHLGVVAMTRGFPAEMESRLALQRSYTPLPAFSQTAQPPRITVETPGPEERFLSVTQVTSGQTDYTGRAAPFVHHLLVNLHQFDDPNVNLADLLPALSSAVYTQWREEPRWIEPPRQVANNGTAVSFPSPIWQQLHADYWRSVLLPAADALFAFHSDQRPIVICLPTHPTCDAFVLVSDVLRLLPNRVQRGLLCLSHVVEVAEALRGAALIFTYPDSPYFAEVQRRQDGHRPHFIDLTASQPPVHELSPYAELLDQNRRQGPDQLAAHLQRMNRCGIGPEDAGGLDDWLAAEPMMQRLRADGVVDPALSEALAKATSSIARYLVEQIRESLPGLAASESPQSWSAMADLRTGEWPIPLQQEADRLLRSKPLTALRALAAAKDTTMFEQLVASFAKQMQEDGSLVTLIEETSDNTDADVAAALIGSLRPTTDVALDWYAALRKNSSPAVSKVRIRIAEALRRSVKSVQHMGVVCKHALAELTNRDNAGDSSFLSEDICLPLLRRHCEKTESADAWVRLATYRVRLGLYGDNINEEVQQLVNQHGDWLDETTVAKWGRGCQDAEQRRRLDNALLAAGLTAEEAGAEQSEVDEPPLFVDEGSRTTRPAKKRKLKGGWRVVGPITTPLALAIATAMCGPWLVLSARPVLAVACLSPPLVWLFGEGVIRKRFHDANQLPRVRMVRWALTLFLLAALATAIGIGLSN